MAHVTTVHSHTDNRIFRKECAALADAGLDVWLVAAAPDSHVDQSVKLVALPKRSGRFGRMILGPLDAWRALRSLRPSVIHVHDPELIPLAILWRLTHRRPAVFDAHEDLAKQVWGKPYLPAPLRPIVARLAGLLERAADSLLTDVVAATPAIARNFPKATVTLVQNFPWLSDFPPPAAAEPGPVRLSYVGGITRERGGLEMLEAVRRADGPVQLVLAGPASTELETAIGREDTQRVRYAGRLPAEDVPGVIAGTHAGLVLFHPLPNHLECQPTKLFEYMASGRPFVASNFPAWERLLGGFGCGYFIDPLDVDALISIINTLDKNPDQARAMGEQGRKALTEHFTFEQEAPRLIGLTRRLLMQDRRQEPVSHELLTAGSGANLKKG